MRNLLYSTSEICQVFKSWIDSNIVETHNVYSAKVCQKTCQKYAQCQYFTYANVTHKTRPLVCFLKNGKLKTKRLNALTSGPKYCPNEYAIMQLSGKLFFSVISDIISDVNSSLICFFFAFWWVTQRYTHRVPQTIQMKLILLWVWAERAVLGSAKTALKFKYEI